ncbi:DUF4352 domain-containing protein [Apibacter adventoris]|uniref:DUF4352 domain-containing protein n=1 Tax=Apibacter adventoris TaxID=1679466 RepID=A0A2S8ADP6_9FLAO|nr:DUF4352 domain-containing protein [Apibacter adventoris]PQL93085.1 hypothetical protein C4S77_05330 [Apibacter adventoris]
MKKHFKTLISALAVVFFSFIAFASLDDDKKDSESSSIDNSFNYIKLGEPLQTKYFEVTVNKINIEDKVDTGNQFADLDKEEGNLYLILNTTFKNISDESRMLMDGEVLINYNGKQYKFDHSETILLDGWGLSLKQINPLTKKTTNLVYKIPAEIKGEVYYRPGRSDKKDLIVLGEIK